MHATYNAIAGDAPLLLVALFVGLGVALGGSYLAGKVADALFAYVRRLDLRVQREAGSFDAADFRRADRLATVAHAIDRTAIRWPLIALYWRYRTIRARRRVRRRIDRLGR